MTRRDISPLRRHYKAPIILGGIGVFLLYFLSFIPFFRNLEYYTYDLRIALRENPIFAGIQAPSHKRNPAIVIIPIDNKTLDEITVPTLFWTPYFAAIIDSLVENDVRAIGIDYQFQISSDEFLKEKINDTLSKAIKNGDLKCEASVFDPFMPSYDRLLTMALLKRKTVLMTFMKEDGKVSYPYDMFKLAAGLENMGLANSSPDEDGVVRRQFVYRTEKTLEGNQEHLAMAVNLARKYLDTDIDYDKDKNLIKLGDREIKCDSRYQFLINYIAPPDSFMTQYSFTDVLKKAQDKDNEYFKKNFANKVVLIGPGYMGSTDIYLTPYSVSTLKRMFGIEIHANILNTILNYDYITIAPRWMNFLFLLVIGFAVSMLSYCLRPLRASLSCLAIAVTVIAVGFFTLYKYNYWINMATPLLAIPLNFASVYTYRFLVEDKEKRFVKDVLGRVASPEVAEVFLRSSSALELGGKKMVISALFCDINDFTTFTEKHDPQDVVAFLNDYFTRMEKVIFKHGGIMKDMIADEIVVLCGAPNEDPEHHYHICDIAIDMVEELKKWNEERKRQKEILEKQGKNKEAEKYEPVGLKFGLHTGEVVVGNIGCPNRIEYTAIGDVMNTASRIMGLTKEKKATILITETLRDKVADRFETEYRGSSVVKGKTEQVKVYALMGRKKVEQKNQ